MEEGIYRNKLVTETDFLCIDVFVTNQPQIFPSLQITGFRNGRGYFVPPGYHAIFLSKLHDFEEDGVYAGTTLFQGYYKNPEFKVWNTGPTVELSPGSKVGTLVYIENGTSCLAKVEVTFIKFQL